MKLLRGLILFCLVPSLAFALNDKTVEAMRTLSAVLHHVSQNYVVEIDEAELMEAAVYGVLERLDPHSSYFPPAALKEHKANTEGRFGGLGLEVTKKHRWLVVVAPVDGSPAMRAGIRAGDRITKINKASTKNMNVHQAVGAMRGKPGSPVTLTVIRAGRGVPQNITLRREKIDIPSVTAEWLEPGYPLVRISSFGEKTFADFFSALQALSKQTPIRGLILDVRNNPGGMLDRAVKMCDYFLEEGVIITRQRRGKEIGRHEATYNGEEPDYPIVVLVNAGSASAAEILAGALQDHQRALIVGNQTFGKGSVQLMLDLDEGAAFKMTIAHYYTPSKRLIHGVGIRPDVIVAEDDPNSSAAQERASADRAQRKRGTRSKLRGRKRIAVPAVNLPDGDLDYQRAVALALLKNGTVARVTKR